MASFTCLSLWNPWAVLAVGPGGGLPAPKQVETRGWPLKLDKDGTRILVIHAASKYDRTTQQIAKGYPFRGALNECGYPDVSKLPRFCYLGAVLVDEVIPSEKAENAAEGFTKVALRLATCARERYFGDYSAGRYCWHLARSVRFPEPVPAKGHQKLWNWFPPDPLAALILQLRED